jgi:protein-disulfide isomerase
MSKAISRSKRAAKKSNNSSMWIIGGVILAAVIVLGLVLINLNTPRATPITPQVSVGRTLGQADAPVTIDLYSDFQCPVCRRAELEIRKLITDYVDTGKAKVVYHNFAFIGPESQAAAQAAECANEQGKFWEYASFLFDHQTGENVGAFSTTNLKQFATDLKLDTGAFNACLDSGKYAQQIQSETAAGSALGIRATPTFMINGKLAEGLLSAQQLGAMIDSYVAAR